MEPSCHQSTDEQQEIIIKAERGGYSIRKLELVGNQNISDSVLRNKMRVLKEGDRFRRKDLIKSLKDVSRLKTLEPVHLTNVVVSLEQEEKVVNILVCFAEKNAVKK